MAIKLHEMRYNKKLIWIFCLALFYSTVAQAYTKRDLLQKSTDVASLKRVLIPGHKWVPYPNYNDRAGWDKLLGPLKEQYIERGNQLLNYKWQLSKVSDYLEFSRSGSRATMEEPFNENITTIAALFIAELAEGKGRFTEQIANGVFATCEMTSWVGVAHLSLQLAKTPFPNHNEQVIDLYSGDVGSLFSWVYYFLNKDFDKLNPLISVRLKDEIQKRILDPYMNVNHLWWMAFDYKPGDMVNNWNPWCNSNVLQCFALMEPDPDKLSKAVYRTMVSVDHFINYNNEDGACEEGPSYWGHAAGKLYDYLKILYDITGGKVTVFNQPIIKNMGEYISRAYVGNGWVVNFADASAKLKPEASLISRYGNAVNSTEMVQFAAYLTKDDRRDELPFFGRDIFRLFQTILYKDDNKNAKPVHNTPAFTWYPQTQFCFMRRDALFFAAKGGYNNESHNHNDIGSFNLYVDDLPVFIDVGVGTYTRQTFGPDRYSIWTMQSAYHNVPEINGYVQPYGAKYKAEKVGFNEKQSIFSLSLKDAYPAEAAVQTWDRLYQLKKDQLTITDKFVLKNPKKENKVNFLVWNPPQKKSPGAIEIIVNNNRLALNYNNRQFDVNIEPIALTDPRLSGIWGEKIYQISFTAKTITASGEYRFIINKM